MITRPAKVPQDPEERQRRWLKDLRALGSSLTELKLIMEKAKERGPIPLPDASLIASRAIQSAVNHLSERKSSFSFQELIKTAKALSLLSTNEGELLSAIEQGIANQSLIYLENKCLTTAQLKEMEKRNIERMQLAKGATFKILPQWLATLYVGFKTPHPKERQTLVDLLTVRDRQLLVSSNSHALLTQTLKQYIEISQQHYFYPRVLTQKNASIEPLKERLGTERVFTIEGFLLACEKRAEEKGVPKHRLDALSRRLKKQAAKDIWIIEGEVSARQLDQLGHFAQIFGARLIFGLVKPVAALEPLKENGLREISLQADEKEVARLKAEAQVLKAIGSLSKNHLVQQEVELEKRQMLAVEQYLKRPNMDKQLITLSYLERNRLNTGVRERLKQTGALTEQGQILNTLRPLNMSQEEKSQAHLWFYEEYSG